MNFSQAMIKKSLKCVDSDCIFLGKTWFPDLETVADLVPIKLLFLKRGKNEAKGEILNITIVFLVEK